MSPRVTVSPSPAGHSRSAPLAATAALVVVMLIGAAGPLLGPHAGGHTWLQALAVVSSGAFLIWMRRAMRLFARGWLRALLAGALFTVALFAPSPGSESFPLLLVSLPFLTAVERMPWTQRIVLTAVLVVAPWAFLARPLVDLPLLSVAGLLSAALGLAMNRGLAALEESPELRRIVARTVRHREDERARLARELHDGTGQLVHGLRLEMELARHAYGPAVRPEVQATLTRMEALLDQLNDSLREVLQDLRPAILDDAGLAKALAALLRDRAAALPHLDIHGSIDEELVVDDKVIAIAIYRVAQEALTNALRHSDAHRIELTLTATDEHLELVVTDDGRGVDPASSAGYGLTHMHERSALIGGTFDLTNNGPGTKLVLRCPRRFKAALISSASLAVRR